VISGSEDGSLKVWDVNTGRCVQSLNATTVLNSLTKHFNSVNGVAVLPDGRVVTGSEDCTLKIWDLTKWWGNCVQTFSKQISQIWCVKVLSDGRVVSGSHYTLTVWDVKSAKCVQTLKVAHTFGYMCC